MTNNFSVLYKDPFFEPMISFDGKEFGTTKLRSCKIVSRVLYNDVIIHSFKVNSSMQERELQTTVEIKMYEEAGLDFQKKYKIIYIKKELEVSDMVLVEAFAIEEVKTKTVLHNVLKNEKYIDFLALPFLVFSSLYTHKILAPKNDLFVYISDNEAFIALYKQGHYISTKSIFTLEEMCKRLKKDDIDINPEELQILLANKGLESNTYKEEERDLFSSIQTVFVEIFTKINDIVMHNRNIFGFDAIDRIFLDSKNNRICGLRAFLINFGFIQTEIHDFKLLKQDVSKNLLGTITALYAWDCLHSSIPENITFISRPPAFLKTDVGKLFLVSTISMILAACYPMYLALNIQELTKEQLLLSEQNEAMKTSSDLLNKELAKIHNDLKNMRIIKEEQSKSLQNISKSIDELYMLKLSPKTYVDFIVDVNRLLKKYNLKVRSLEQQGNNKMLLEVFATEAQRDTIAKFMEELLAQGFLGVTTDEVHSDKSIYISKIEILR